MGARFDRIDVTFDRYQEHSIKDNTKSKRIQGCHPVRKPVNGGSVPLPNSWSDFMALAQNKEDLAELLSEQLLLHAPVGRTIVVSGGFKKSTAVKSSNKALGMTLLQATHEPIHGLCCTVHILTLIRLWCLLETQMCLFCWWHISHLCSAIDCGWNQEQQRSKSTCLFTIYINSISKVNWMNWLHFMQLQAVTVFRILPDMTKKNRLENISVPTYTSTKNWCWRI